MKELKCIYCLKVFRNGGEGDHVIPRGFGLFENDKHFYGICTDCNSVIGKSEQQMIECGPVGDILRKLGPIKSHGKTRIRKPKRAHGADPPFREIEDPFLGKWTPIRNEEDQFEERIRLLDIDGNEHKIKLHPKMTAKSLQKLLSKIEIPDKPLWRFHAHQDNSDHYLSIIKEIYPSAEIKSENILEQGIHLREGYSRYETTDYHYFRGLAKIAFHYYLVNQPFITGDEAEFSMIRDFILNGNEDGYQTIFKTRRLFMVPEYDRSETCIILGFLEEGYGHVTSHITFNPGSLDCLEEHYWLYIGKRHKNNCRLDYKSVHAYVYYPPGHKHAKAGIVKRLA